MLAEVGYLRYEEEANRWIWEERRERRSGQHVRVRHDEETVGSYEVVVSGKPISLEFSEFQIIKVLAQRPYHAFRGQEIVDAVQAAGAAGVTLDNLREAVVELRGKLGFFRDFIQTVPYIGYRFRP